MPRQCARMILLPSGARARCKRPASGPRIFCLQHDPHWNRARQGELDTQTSARLARHKLTWDQLDVLVKRLGCGTVGLPAGLDESPSPVIHLTALEAIKLARKLQAASPEEGSE